MEPNERGRKQIEAGSAQRKSKAKRPGPGQLKGRPVGDVDRPERVKPSIRASASKRAGVAQRERDRAPQLERPVASVSIAQQSMRLRLRVEGESIVILDADIVDAPGSLPEDLRGSHFLEVRVGNQILAAQVLRDPGIAVGIPDRSAGDALRGHRFLQLDHYELAVRVPLGPLESLISERLQGSGASRPPAAPRLEVSIFEARANLALDPRRSGSLLAQGREELDRVAKSDPIPLDQLYGAGGRQRKATEQPR